MSQSCSRALYFWEELLSTLENFFSRPEGFFLTWICFQPHDHGFSSLQTVFNFTVLFLFAFQAHSTPGNFFPTWPGSFRFLGKVTL